MSVTADKRYGRQGGRWLDLRTDHDACQTCTNADARYLAHHTCTGETWRVCNRCREQGTRLKAPVIYQTLEASP